MAVKGNRLLGEGVQGSDTKSCLTSCIPEYR